MAILAVFLQYAITLGNYVLKTNIAAKASCFKLTGTDILCQLLYTNPIHWYLYKPIHYLTDAHCYLLMELHKIKERLYSILPPSSI